MKLDKATELAMLFKAADLWREYRLMFLAEGGKRERQAMAELEQRVSEAFSQFNYAALSKGQRLDFGQLHLKLLALKAIGTGCRLCGAAVSHASVGLMWMTPPDRGLPNAWALRNVLAGCERCAKGKGKHSAREWQELLAALQTSEGGAAEDTLNRLAAGAASCNEFPSVRGQKVLSRGRRPRVTR